MGMGVGSRPAVRGPARVAEADDGRRLCRPAAAMSASRLPTERTRPMPPSPEHDTRRVVAAILEMPQAVEDDRLAGPAPGVPYDAAHGSSLLGTRRRRGADGTSGPLCTAVTDGISRFGHDRVGPEASAELDEPPPRHPQAPRGGQNTLLPSPPSLSPSLPPSPPRGLGPLGRRAGVRAAGPLRGDSVPRSRGAAPSGQVLLHDRHDAVAEASQSSCVGASAMTRTSGSVPDGRTRCGHAAEALVSRATACPDRRGAHRAPRGRAPAR